MVGYCPCAATPHIAHSHANPYNVIHYNHIVIEFDGNQSEPKQTQLTIKCINLPINYLALHLLVI